MFSKYIPDMYQKSIYSINYNKLKTLGIKCLIFDLDNTISPITLKEPTPKLKKLFNKLKNLGFKCIILSNNSKNRVEPFKDILAVDAGFRAKKPSDKKYIKIMNNYGFKPHEIVAIGDQLLTDIKVANKAGLTSIFVNQMGAKDLKVSIFNRFIEKIILSYFLYKDLFIKGRYYE